MTKRLSKDPDVIPYVIFAGLLFGFAFLLRLPQIFSVSMSGDEPLYGWYAKRLLTDPGFIFSREISEYHLPTFPALLAIGNFLFPAGFLGYRCCVLLMNMAGIAAMYALGRRVGGPFVGLIGAALLSYNFLYFHYSTTVMIDGPMTVAVTVLLWLLAGTDGRSRFVRHVLVGLMAVGILGLKWSGLFVIPWLAVYYSFLPEEKSWHRKLCLLAIPFSIIAGFLMTIFFVNALRWGKPFPYYIPSSGGEHFSGPFWYYFLKQHSIFMFLHLLPVFYYGLFKLVRNESRYRTLIFSSLGVILAAVSLFPVKDLRYGLLLVPAMALTTAMGLDFLVRQMFAREFSLRLARYVCIFFVLGLCFFYQKKIISMTESNSTVWTGYDEAGAWISQNAKPGTTIVAQMPRMVRYYTNKELVEYGGNIAGSSIFKQGFEALVSGIPGPIILETSFWFEKDKIDLPSFLAPKKEIAYLQGLGFQLKKEIVRTVYDKNQNRQELPVIRIYQRD